VADVQLFDLRDRRNGADVPNGQAVPAWTASPSFAACAAESIRARKVESSLGWCA
jgi:hypothetical protein